MGVQFYRCPNCGRIYGYGEFDERTTIINCLNCRYPLKKYQDVKHVRHPELSEPKVIGTIDDLNESQITCPTCSSTNVYLSSLIFLVSMLISLLILLLR